MYQLKRRFVNYLPNLFGDLLKILCVFIFIFPFYWMIITSFKTYGEAIQVPPTLWPKNFTFEAYVNIYNMGISFWQYASNSIIVTAGVIVLQCLVMIPAA